jgi:fibronectin type 3 domain-containing protein
VALSWTASPGADYYSVLRTTVYSDGVGGLIPLRTNVLNDMTTATTFTDKTPTNGRTYTYTVTASNAAGASDASNSVKVVPLPPAPASAPDSFVAKWTKGREGVGITLNWSPVPGAVGYVLYRSKGTNGKFNWPDDFLTTIMETTYTDVNHSKRGARPDLHMNSENSYSYQVTAVNAGGASPSATVQVKSQGN